MDETGNIISKEAEVANHVPEVENDAPPSYGFVNPVATVTHNQLPPVAYTAYDQSVPPKAML
jgi:hypothetical protein